MHSFIIEYFTSPSPAPRSLISSLFYKAALIDGCKIIEPIATAQSPEEVVNVLNQLSQSQEGNQVVSAMFQAFQKSLTSKMFNGGKLKQLLDKCQKWK